MATIVDVARAAGCSVATVSRVLNGKRAQEGELAHRVLDAARALDYVPNSAARNLRKSESRVILILLPNVTNPYYAHILSGIGDAAYRHGYSHFLCNTGNRREREEAVLGRLTRRQADGAILMATELGSAWLKPYAERYPIVQCSEFDPEVDIAHVSVDNYRAALEVMDHLMGLGHRKIGIISSENRYSSTAQRMEGYCDALKREGLPVSEDYIRCADAGYSFKSGFDAAVSLLSQEERPTALFCISDVLALGAIAGARELGLSVPGDVAVVGFDDVEHTTMFRPYLTTVGQPCYDIGYRAMEMLIGLLGGEEVPRELKLAHRLTVRESSGFRKHALDLAVARPSSQ